MPGYRIQDGRMQMLGYKQKDANARIEDEKIQRTEDIG
jgi:hypothetical protein